MCAPFPAGRGFGFTDEGCGQDFFKAISFQNLEFKAFFKVVSGFLKFHFPRADQRQNPKKPNSMLPSFENVAKMPGNILFLELPCF